MKTLFIYLESGAESLAIEYLSSALKQKGHSTDLIIEKNNEKDFKDRLKQRIINFKPDFVCFSVVTDNYKWAKELAYYCSLVSDVKIIFGGIQATSCPKEVLSNDFINYVVVGEGDKAIVDIIEGKVKYRLVNGGLIEDLDTLPFPDKELFYKEAPYRKYKYYCIVGKGCPFSCITGDTIINTINGDISIKDLVGKEIGVYSYDLKNKEVFITEAINIRQTGIKDLVRIKFDDGTHIDCTPDHKFLTFKNGNQFVDVMEIPKKAIELNIGESIRSFKFERYYKDYINVCWGRRKSRKRSRMVMDFIIGRKLRREEFVHHIDRNKLNDNPENLILCSNKEHIGKWHPEFSERMKKENPQKFVSKESYRLMGEKNRGIKRSMECRVKHRNAQLGKNNSYYRKGKYLGKPSRIKELNHKVISIENIGKGEVYNMEVPKTNWFFANNVLVHNCTYCFNNYMKKLYLGSKWVRKRSVKSVVNELVWAKKFKPQTIYFADDCLTNDKEWLKQFIKEYKEKVNIPFTGQSHPTLLDDETCKLLKSAGCLKMQIGSQTISEEKRRIICNRFETNKSIQKAVDNLKANKIFVQVDHIFQLPTETLEEYQDGLNFYVDLKPDQFESFILQYYPNTEVLQIGKKLGIITEEIEQQIIKGEKYPDLSFTNKEIERIYYFMFWIPVLPRSLSRFIVRNKLYWMFNEHIMFVPKYIKYLLTPSLIKQKLERMMVK